MNIEYLLKVKNYIESMETTLEHEWGSCRSFEEVREAEHLEGQDLYEETLRLMLEEAE